MIQAKIHNLKINQGSPHPWAYEQHQLDSVQYIKKKEKNCLALAVVEHAFNHTALGRQRQVGSL